VAAAAISAVIALPLLPAAALARFPMQKVNYDLGEEIGWPSQAGLVARVYDALPVAERSAATVIAGNYGEAGALDRYGAGLGLPPVYSGDNNYWLWGGRRRRATPSPSSSLPARPPRRCSTAGSARSGSRPSTGTGHACPTTRRAR
jgi:hypothetical protein